jgi:hypothetical protein
MSLLDFNVNMRDNNGELTFANLVDRLRNIEQRVSSSLSRAVEKSRVSHRAFIQQEAASEEILNDLLLTTQNMVIGWILTAIQLNNKVDSARTVRDVLDTVSTEAAHYANFISEVELVGSFENYSPKMGVLTPNKNLGGTGPAKVHNLPDKLSLASGRIIEVQFTPNPDEPNQKMTVQLFLQFNPFIVSADVCRAFFENNFKLDLKKRWFQFTSGEINFFRDFLFEFDRLNKRTKAMKADTSGQLKELEDAKRNSLISYVAKLFGWRSNRENIASSINIFLKQDFDQWCRELHCNFEKDYSVRQKFFNATFSLMVIIVDPSYRTVTYYYNGVRDSGKYTYDQIIRQAKPESLNLKSMMQSYYQSTAPKF